MSDANDDAGVTGSAPTPFFVSVASRRLRFPISPLEATLMGILQLLFLKDLRCGMICWFYESVLKCNYTISFIFFKRNKGSGSGFV